MKKYVKHHSFGVFHSRLGVDLEDQRSRALKAVVAALSSGELPSGWSQVLERVMKDLADDATNGENPRITITQFIADEMAILKDSELARYLYHRYRYDVYPRTHELDDYPPYVQIEPSSRCNFRCLFCYQKDPSFSGQDSRFMGQMDIDLFKRIIDQCEGHVEFGSLSSRGEPFLCKNICRMIDYCKGKFMSLKINTNGSLLKEKHVHSILSGDVRTLVFSADAADEPDYSRLRVNGLLERLLRNVEMFQKIRDREYSDAKIITRVSGVMYDHENQDSQKMVAFWGASVDQVAFVKYNPWEMVYEADLTGVDTPCSDLWRRMFVWYDGSVNPCDTDYKSFLCVGSIRNKSLGELWQSDAYGKLRKQHLQGKRYQLEPCRRCTLV